MVSSLPFLMLHDINIVTNAELNCPHNVIIQIGEDCSWFIIPYVAPNSIFQRFHHMNSCSLQPKLMYLYTTLLPTTSAASVITFILGVLGGRGSLSRTVNTFSRNYATESE